MYVHVCIGIHLRVTGQDMLQSRAFPPCGTNSQVFAVRHPLVTDKKTPSQAKPTTHLATTSTPPLQQLGSIEPRQHHGRGGGGDGGGR